MVLTLGYYINYFSFVYDLSPQIKVPREHKFIPRVHYCMSNVKKRYSFNICQINHLSISKDKDVVEKEPPAPVGRIGSTLYYEITELLSLSHRFLWLYSYSLVALIKSGIYFLRRWKKALQRLRAWSFSPGWNVSWLLLWARSPWVPASLSIWKPHGVRRKMSLHCSNPKLLSVT